MLTVSKGVHFNAESIFCNEMGAFALYGYLLEDADL
jgi:hypothetical protein